MNSQESLRQKRDQDLKKDYDKLRQKHPQWKYVAYLEYLSEKYYVSAKTVQQIILGVGHYKEAPSKQLDLFSSSPDKSDK
jgi:hypothetical protein